MSHRQSCDRCRQQKVRCLREEAAARGESNTSAASNNNNATSPGGRGPFVRCERCIKAGAECVYSVGPTPRPRSNRRSLQSSAIRRETGPGPRSLDTTSTSWFEQGLPGTMYPSGPSLASFTDLVGQFPGIEETGSVTSNSQHGWNTHHLPPFSPTVWNPLASPCATDVIPISTALSLTDDRGSRDRSRDDSDDGDDATHPTDALSAQLVALSQRATRAVRRLARPGRAPLTVSSREVNEALEDTNTLIRIINSINPADRDPNKLDAAPPSPPDTGLAFSALACHQHLVALFRAICDAIHRCLKEQQQQQQQQQQAQQQQTQQQHHLLRQRSDVEPSSIAQFVMVLQLLMHLINRMDRSFVRTPTWAGPTSFMSGYISPTPSANHQAIDHIQSDALGGSPAPQSGLLSMVQDVVGAIPNEHVKLRQIIQQLQTEMELSELH